MNRSVVVLIVLMVSIVVCSCNEDAGTFPEMLARDIQISVSKGRTWFYIFENDGSCECTVANALGESEVKTAIERADNAGLNIKIIIPLSSGYSEREFSILSGIKQKIEKGGEGSYSLCVRMIPKEKEILNEVSPGGYFARVIYFSGSFICQEIKSKDEIRDRKYVRRYPYAPRLAERLKDSFEKAWEKSVPLSEEKRLRHSVKDNEL